jgi:hypothetical protein
LEPDAAEVERQQAQVAALRQISGELKALNVDVAAMRSSPIIRLKRQSMVIIVAMGILLAGVLGAFLAWAVREAVLTYVRNQ